MPIINQVVQGGGGSSVAEPYLEYEVEANGNMQGSTTTSRIIDLTGVKYLNMPLQAAYRNNTHISGVVEFNMQTVIDRALNATFQNCTGITKLVLPELIGTGSYGLMNVCSGCTNLVEISIPKVTTVGQQGLQSAVSASAIVTFKLESVETLSSNAMNGACWGCTQLQSVWFYALKSRSSTNVLSGFLGNVTGCTIHFPMALDPQGGSTVVSGLTGYPDFGGTNTAVLYDIVTSLTGADSNTYTRSEKDSTSTATAWSYNGTLYYTSGVSDNTNGVNEPSVADTIYSDDACTQSVTTITAIS